MTQNNFVRLCDWTLWRGLLVRRPEGLNEMDRFCSLPFHRILACSLDIENYNSVFLNYILLLVCGFFLRVLLPVYSSVHGTFERIPLSKRPFLREILLAFFSFFSFFPSSIWNRSGNICSKGWRVVPHWRKSCSDSKSKLSKFATNSRKAAKKEFTFSSFWLSFPLTFESSQTDRWHGKSVWQSQLERAKRPFLAFPLIIHKRL